MYNEVIDSHNEVVHGYYRIKQKFNNNIGKKEKKIRNLLLKI